MKLEYQRIFKYWLRKARKSKGISQSALAGEVGYDRSYITKIETTALSINYHTASEIVSKFDLGLIIDQDKIKEFEDVFLKLYIATMSIDDKSVESCHNYIERNKDEIVNSLCAYKYRLSILCYDLYKGISYGDDLISDLLKIDENGFFSNEDRQILYNLIGYHHARKRDFDTSHSWYMKSMSIDAHSLGYAMSAYRGTVKILQGESYVSAVMMLGEAKNIFKEYGIDQKVFDCDMLLGYIASKIESHKEASDIYSDLIERCKVNNYRDFIRFVTAKLHNIIDLQDDDEVKTMIRTINRDHLAKLDLDLCCTILYYYCKKRDIANFQKWYDLSKTLKDERLNSGLITLFRAVIENERPQVVVNIAYEVIEACDIHFDKTELSMLKATLLDYWRNTDMRKESADLILEVLYKIHTDRCHQV